MQSPTASDPSFKAFLDKLQEQNNRTFVTQLVQLKAEREIAGEDGDKREEQLDDINETLKDLKAAVTGINLDAPAIDFTPVVDSLSNVTEVLLKSLEEHSVLRKISEGRVKFDANTQRYHLEGKEAKNKMVKEADVRTTSTKDAMAAPVATRNRGPVNSKDLKIQGKVSEDATVEDIAAARGAVGPDRGSDLTDPALKLKPINYTPGNVAGRATGAKEKDTEEEAPVDTRGFFKTLIDEVKQTPGQVRDYLIGFEEKKKKTEPSDAVKGVNPESDNVRDSQEIIADNSKSDIELSKEMLDTTRAQLDVLKEIRDALAPKTPGEKSSGKAGPSPEAAPAEEQGSMLGDLASTAGDFLGKGKKAAGSIGSKLAKFATSKTGKVLGSVAAVGLGAYTAYQGYTAAEDSKQVKLEDVQAKVDAGELSPEDAAAQRKDIGNSATIEKSGAIGEGTGMAAGAIAGASLGATIGSVVPGIGTAIGGIAGGALGAFAGSKAGKVVGEYGGKAINAVGEGVDKAGSFFSGIGDKVKGVYNSGIGLNDQAKGVAMADQMVSSTGEVATSDKSISRGPGLEVTTSTANTKEGVTAQKSVLGSTFLGGLFTAKGKESGSFLGTSSDEKMVEGKVEGKQINQTDAKYGSMLGQRISGGLFGKDTYKVSSEMSGTGGDSAEYDTEVTKHEYKQLQELNAKGDVEGARKKLASIKAAKAAALEPSGVDAMGNVTGAQPSVMTGMEVAKTSTENKDIERESAVKPAGGNTVVSNNVNNSSTTKYVPIKGAPRPEYTGSSLDRYNSRVAVY